MLTEAVGYQWEKAVFGLSSEHRRMFRPMSRIAGIKKVIGEQVNLGWNPKTPHTKVGQELFECVQSYLTEEEAQKLKLYCAIGTVLDLMHNTDGFFMIDNRILPIDLKSGSLPPQYENGSFLLMQKECTGMSLWRSCLKIARAFNPECKDKFIYTVDL